MTFQKPNILDLTTCLLLRFHKTGLIRKGNIAKIQTIANKQHLGLNKKILESENYDHMLLIARDVRRYTMKRQVPGSPFSEGTHLIPSPLVDELNEKITNAEQGYNKFADAFICEYANLVEEAKTQLKDQFDQSNYFDVATLEGRNQLRNKFWVERRWFDWSPSNSSKVSKAIAYQEQQRQAEEIKDMGVQIKSALRFGLKNLIDHLVDRLTPHQNGNRKLFAATSVTKVVDFLDLFSARNVCNDTELALLADQAKDILAGQTPDSLRENEDIKAVVAKRMSVVKDQLDKLLHDMPKRAINLDDEDNDDEDEIDG